jgi:hypothetical protein
MISVMMPYTSPVVMSPPVLRSDWKTLTRLASTRSKPLNLNACPASTSLHRFCGTTNKPKFAWFWVTNHQTRAASFEAQIRKPEPPVLRPNREKSSQWFWGQTNDKPSILVLSLNQETHVPRLLVYGADRTQHHPTPLSSGHRVSDLCLTIFGPLHHVFYSCHDPRCCLPCHTCQLHTTRQANAILRTNKDKRVEPPNCFRFKFKP